LANSDPCHNNFVTYPEALAYVAALPPRQYRGGVERMQAFLAQAGLDNFLGPQPAYFHVAGTNGKGSTTAYLQSILVEAGIRSGAFFSPYVYDPRERIQLGRDLIPEADFARLATELRALGREDISEFEFKTALGFAFWKENAVDAVALEVGLGGRFDATNVVRSAATMVVSIGLDHVNILGDTYAEIAFQKAGIFKRGVPAIIGSLNPEAQATTESVALEVGAPLFRLGHEIILENNAVTIHGTEIAGLEPGIQGAMQRENMVLAVAAMVLTRTVTDPDILRRGVKHARIPGRFERRTLRGLPCLLDGAHNGEASQVLREGLDRAFPGQKFTLITGMVRGHDAGRFYSPLRDVIEQALFVPVPGPRGRDPQELAPGSGLPNATAYEHLPEAVDAALRRGNPILVTGSFYLLGEIAPMLDAGRV
jgi:dihydrofolate synthase / folylpolyglutamate synthase